ncbi:hypothetical protein H9635_18395 [Solibacillus sp. A46]|uniref:Uncharacterized protein n=1 Tax=Solibacillus faecavium TaxID=2762221 RepID=A0ABR8Y3D0_9BACL|nr:hypothetical protein [Solibacillus faecavium]MBD8038718.1 hypothetical protein [Solibacillus faecavium]
MKSVKIYLAIILGGILLHNLIFIETASATNDSIHTPEETTIISTEIFEPNKSNTNGYFNGEIISPLSNDPGYGAVKINDALSSLNGLREQADRNFTSFESFKGASIEIASSLPVIGKWVETGSTIWSHLKNVGADIGSGTGKTTDVKTSYSDRYFYHWLYVWDYTNSWKDMGYSVSRYWYKNITVSYLDKSCDCVQNAAYDYSRLANSPNKISKAPNYMNKTRLSTIVQSRWSSNFGSYTESY